MPNKHSTSTAFILAFIGVLIFSFTLPLTKYAIAHGMSAPFIAFGRTVLAGLVALIYLCIKREKLPPRDTWRDIGLSSLGVVIGFYALAKVFELADACGALADPERASARMKSYLSVACGVEA